MTYVDVINIWPTPGALAEAIGAKEETVRKWRQRNSIPPEWANLIIKAAPRKAGLTAKKWLDIAQESRPPQLEQLE